MADKNKIKTQKEAAAYADVDVRTIRRWLRKGSIFILNGYFNIPSLDAQKKLNEKRKSGKLAFRKQVKAVVGELAELRAKLNEEIAGMEKKLLSAVKPKD